LRLFLLLQLDESVHSRGDIAHGPAGIQLLRRILAEISDDWETDRAYLNMEAR
jgi:hypothetical protein